MQHQDVAVIGGGPAGLAAGIYLAQYGIDATILEEKIAGGYAAEIPSLENYPGCHKGTSGKDLTDKMVRQCEDIGTDIHQLERVTGLASEGKKHIVKTEKSDYSVDAVIIASGRHAGEHGVVGEKQFQGKGVSHCAVCDGFFFKKKKVIVAGEERRAAEVAIYLSGVASDVKLVCRKKKLCAEKILLEELDKHNVEILSVMELKEIKGDLKVENVVLADLATGEMKEMDADGIFFQSEGIPNSQIAREYGVKVDGDGYICVDDKGRTNIDRVYAIGDITTSPIKLVATAVAQAATAALDVIHYF